MTRILVLVALGVIVWRLVTGRWPWEKKVSARQQALFNARKLLEVETNATREQILAAHRRRIATVHPDRGGSSAQVHEANDARDLLLSALPLPDTNPPQEPS